MYYFDNVIDKDAIKYGYKVKKMILYTKWTKFIN